MKFMKFTRVLLVIVALLMITVLAEGKEKVVFPEKGKQIRMIITHGIGGSVDLAARGMAPFLQKYLGIPVVPEQMEGAGGRRARTYIYTAKPDGYTICVSAQPSAVIGELSYPDTKYHVLELVHLGMWSNGDDRCVVVKADSPVKTWKDLVALADKTAATGKNLKGAGGGGTGSTSMLQLVYLKEKIKLKADFIPFDSTAEVANAVVGGQTAFGVMPLSSGLRFMKQGDLRILVTHGSKRYPEIPDVPTFKDLGVKNVELSDGNGAFAPPGTPREIQLAYSKAIKQAFDDPEFQAWAKKTNVMTQYLSGDDFLKLNKAYYKSMSGILDMLRNATQTEDNRLSTQQKK